MSATHAASTETASAETAPSPDAVFNQTPFFEGINLWGTDRPLREATERHGGGWIAPAAEALGARCGSAEVMGWGRLANDHAPELHRFDRVGRRLDEVEYHPAYHDLMRLGIGAETHSLPWAIAPHTAPEGAHVARAALMTLRHQVDEGTSCPLTMTFAAVPALRRQPNVAATWVPRLLSSEYDPRLISPDEKAGCTVGMAMTERQGGSDVRANTTRAAPVEGGGPGTWYRLDGHKWFCSAPMSDAFLVLAQATDRLSCFLLPRVLPDGTRNGGFRIERLKDKLGNRSNASSEVTFEGAQAQLIGEEGRGVATIIEMVRHTRLDCAIGSAATVRRALAEALHHAAHREVFGKRLLDQSLMRNVLADLCLTSEAATAFAFRLAEGFDRAQAGDEPEAAFVRLATTLAKFWVTKRAVAGVAEAMECLGGNGYVEASGMPRLYRDVPVNAIWEGAGNVQALDVLRALARDSITGEAVRAEINKAEGEHPALDALIEVLDADLHRLASVDRADAEFGARRLASHLSLALQASLLIRHAPPAVSDAFCAARLGRTAGAGLVFGDLPRGLDVEPILTRHRPQAA